MGAGELSAMLLATALGNNLVLAQGLGADRQLQPLPLDQAAGATLVAPARVVLRPRGQVELPIAIQNSALTAADVYYGGRPLELAGLRIGDGCGLPGGTRAMTARVRGDNRRMVQAERAGRGAPAPPHPAWGEFQSVPSAAANPPRMYDIRSLAQVFTPMQDISAQHRSG